MSLIPIEVAHGEIWFDRQPGPLGPKLSRFTAPLAALDGTREFRDVRNEQRLGGPVYVLMHEDGLRIATDAPSRSRNSTPRVKSHA